MISNTVTEINRVEEQGQENKNLFNEIIYCRDYQYNILKFLDEKDGLNYISTCKELSKNKDIVYMFNHLYCIKEDINEIKDEDKCKVTKMILYTRERIEGSFSEDYNHCKNKLHIYKNVKTKGLEKFKNLEYVICLTNNDILKKIPSKIKKLKMKYDKRKDVEYDISDLKQIGHVRYCKFNLKRVKCMNNRIKKGTIKRFTELKKIVCNYLYEEIIDELTDKVEEIEIKLNNEIEYDVKKYPKKLKKYTIKKLNDHNLKKLPDSIEELILKGKKYKIEKYPKNLKKLTIQELDDMTIKNLPDSIEELIIDGNKIKVERYPKNLKKLSINGVIDVKGLSENIKKITFGNNMNNMDKEEIKIPDNVEKIVYKYCYDLNISVPKNLKEIKIVRDKFMDLTDMLTEKYVYELPEDILIIDCERSIYSYFNEEDDLIDEKENLKAFYTVNDVKEIIEEEYLYEYEKFIF